MIDSLTIKNLFLIDDLSLHFNSGFTVFTGETGSGKSAILNAIRLLLGEKADPSFLRKGCETGSAIGTFSEFDRSYLLSKGIEIDEDEPVIIQREISSNGKSRASINHQPVSLSLLKELGKELIEIADQGATLILKDEALHQKYFDLFAEIDLSESAHLYQSLEEDKRQLLDLLAQSGQKEREIANLEREIAEIETHFLTEEEEKQLFETYALLSKSEERKLLAQRFMEELPAIKPSHQTLTKLAQLDPSLLPHCLALYELIVELSEISHTVNQYVHTIDLSPEKLELIDEKLSKMARLKKKFGNEIQSALQASKARLDQLLKLDEHIIHLKETIAHKQLQVDSLFEAITKKRHSAKCAFEKQIETELRTLNIPTARFSVEIEPKNRSAIGDEAVYFLLAPNVGEKLIRVKDQISGGEMARLLLTLLTLLASKEKKPLIVFDEIDANIGGQTALTIGQKFLQLAKNRQVIAITHFPQVAIAANHHFVINKIHQNMRTLTQVRSLRDEEIQLELQRMRGE